MKIKKGKMQRFKLYPQTSTVIGNFIEDNYNAFILKLARRSAIKMCEYKNKTIYGLEMYNAIHIMTSIEKKDIDKVMPAGNKMNIAETLKHQTFMITPESIRKKNT